MAVLRGDDARVGFAELFFDLVFVFAITQVSHVLVAHYDLKGALETGFLFLAVWWVWIYSTWVLNRLDPDQLQVRVLLFSLMAAGLFLSMALPEAFGDRGLVFALAYVGMQVGRTVFVWLAASGNTIFSRTYLRILVWFVVAAVLWIAGASVEGTARLWLWGAALGIEYLGPVAGYFVPGIGRDVSANWAVKGGHIAERCGLFVIICLGETLLVAGATFAELEWDAAGTLAFLAAVGQAIAMWWVYFHIGHKRGTHQIEHSANPGQLARLAFTYLHIPIVAGIVVSAVASERAIVHPGDAGVLAESASAIGGLALFLLGNGLFKRVSARNFPLSHWVGLALCVVAAAVGPWTTLLVLNLAAVAILVLVAVWEDQSFAAGEARVAKRA
jgi:low temperature requirement protein LtrA